MHGIVEPMRSSVRLVFTAAVLLLAVAAPGALGAQGNRLGTLRFPNSGARAAQRPFIRGVLLLHSFEYPSAAAAFRKAQKADPGFALAYWGEAMTWTHPVWNQQDVDSARAVLQRLGPTPEARRAKARTRREQDYLGAVETLYGEGSKARRDTLYCAAMERLSAAHPEDLEAEAFYALALLGLSQGTRNVPTYIRAGVLAEDVFRKNPDHPGAAQYIIHAFDDPVHAPLGLRAARAYSKIAPDAPHAQHMTSHIFVALGMWDETVAANVVASGPDPRSWPPGHYTAWLDYGYLQQGRPDEARRLIEAIRPNLGDPPRMGRRLYLLDMRAQYLVNSGRWDDSIRTWPVSRTDVDSTTLGVDAFALGYAALQRGDRAAADSLLGVLAALAKPASTDKQYGATPGVVPILEKELRGLLRLADSAPDEAVALLRKATELEDALPVDFGPPEVVKPSHELLGEVLLGLRRPADAQAEFVRALALAPRRSLSLLGLMRSARAAGDEETAAQVSSELRRVWHAAEPGLPGLAEVSGVSSSAH
jgi:tetratricopeptide (TPR) repeat protein